MNKRYKRMGFVAGIAVAALAIGGTASAMIAGGPASPSPPSGPAVSKQFAACLDAHRTYCADPNAQHLAPVQPQTTLAAAMTRADAVSSALTGVDPKAKATATAVANLMPLSSYEKTAYNGAHVNGTLAPSTPVWVVAVNGAPDPAAIDAPHGQQRGVYTHFTVVIDASTHHWIEEDFEP